MSPEMEPAIAIAAVGGSGTPSSSGVYRDKDPSSFDAKDLAYVESLGHFRH